MILANNTVGGRLVVLACLLLSRFSEVRMVEAFVASQMSSSRWLTPQSYPLQNHHMSYGGSLNLQTKRSAQTFISGSGYLVRLFAVSDDADSSIDEDEVHTSSGAFGYSMIEEKFSGGSMDASPSILPSQTMTAAMMLAATGLTAFPMEAAAAASNVVPQALWAYAHYFSILAIFGCLSAERVLVKASMSADDEQTLSFIDLAYGLVSILLFVSGYYRVVEFGKGFDFYSHEISFWIKMCFAGVLGGLSLFPTIIILKRGQARGKDEVDLPPMSEELADRMNQVINAELSAILTIPLLATFMARGVWYWDDFPWTAGVALWLLATGGACYLYAKQALSWSEEETAGILKSEE